MDVSLMPAEYQGDPWNNALMKMCTSADSVFQTPSTRLYRVFMDRPELYLQWHNVHTGGYYLCIGCACCSMCTSHYQPQNLVDDLGLNPQNLPTKELKKIPEVQRAFRNFLAVILGEPDLNGTLAITNGWS